MSYMGRRRCPPVPAAGQLLDFSPPREIILKGSSFSKVGKVGRRSRLFYSLPPLTDRSEDPGSRFSPMGPLREFEQVLYGALNPAGALAETILRWHDGPFGTNFMPYARLLERELFQIKVVGRNLSLISLRGSGLRQLSEIHRPFDDLLQCGVEDYELTQAWATWLLDAAVRNAQREGQPEPDGLTWMSRQNNTEQIILLRESTCALNVEVVEGSACLLTDEPLLSKIKEEMRQMNIVLSDDPITD